MGALEDLETIVEAAEPQARGLLSRLTGIAHRQERIIPQTVKLRAELACNDLNNLLGRLEQIRKLLKQKREQTLNV
jgi:hypothetical protein